MGWWLALPVPVRGWIEKIFSLAAWSIVCVVVGAIASWNILHNKFKAEKLALENEQSRATITMLQNSQKAQAEVAKQLDLIRQDNVASKAAVKDKFDKLSEDFHNELSKPASKCAPTDRAISLWYDSLRPRNDPKPGQANPAK